MNAVAGEVHRGAETNTPPRQHEGGEVNVEAMLTELGQARRDAADPDTLRPFINEMELCDLEDQAHKGVAHRSVKGGRLYVRHNECSLDPKCAGHRRYWFEDGCDYVEVTRDQALELL